MSYYKTTIKLVSKFLGSSRPDKNNIRRIMRNVNKDPLLFTKALVSQVKLHIKEYADVENTIHITNIINFQPIVFIVSNATPEVYERRFVAKATSTEKIEYFETLPVGAELMLKFYVDEATLPFSSVTKLLHRISEHASISQFGAAWGYGQFIVTDIQPDEYVLPSLSSDNELSTIGSSMAELQTMITETSYPLANEHPNYIKNPTPQICSGK